MKNTPRVNCCGIFLEPKIKIFRSVNSRNIVRVRLRYVLKYIIVHKYTILVLACSLAVLLESCEFTLYPWPTIVSYYIKRRRFLYERILCSWVRPKPIKIR
jgi:hypothetical protein